MKRINEVDYQKRERNQNFSGWLKFSFSILLIHLVLQTDPATGQITLLENFEDQDLSQNPAWTGDLIDFSFIEDFGNMLLHLDSDPTPNRSQIRTSSNTAYGSWEFYVQVPATSTQNRVYFYLISDKEELDIVGDSPSTANGYAIHTGGGHFDLVKIVNGHHSEVLLSSHTAIDTGVGYQVKVTRDESGEWEVYVGEGYGSDPVLDSGSVVDQTFTESEFFGIYVRYSSLNTANYFFDRIVISDLDEENENGEETDDGNGGEDEYEDGSEDDGEEDGNEEENGGVGDNGDGNGDEEEGDSDGENGDRSGEDNGDDVQNGDDENSDEPVGENDEENNDHNDEQDEEEGSESDDDTNDESGGSNEEGGSSDTDSTDDHDTEDSGPVIHPGELLISEFYYRVPIHWRTDTFDRPQYIELYNQSGTQLNLRNLRISGENISIDTDLIMDPNEYLVIARGVPVFEHRFGPRNFIEADQFPRFNLTTTGTITLENAQGQTLEELTFTANEWGGNGVSLERLSFDLSANLRGNWEESIDALTGSPGLPNTVTIPDSPPIVESITVSAPRTIRVWFSRELNEYTSSELSYFSLDKGADITSVEFLSGGSLLQFSTVENLEQFTNYTFTYTQVEDIFGNRVIEDQDLIFSFENPFKIQSVELLDQQQALIVHFTLPVNLSKSEEAEFRLTNGVTVSSIDFVNSSTALLSFGVPFTTGSYELIVNQLESFDPDLPEQWIIESNSTFRFFKFDEYKEGDLVINEFMYRPPTGYPRYIEIYNRSTRFLNMKEWQLRRREGTSNNGGMISVSNLPINAGEYLVITSDLNLMQAVFGDGPWFEMSSYPGFTQTAADQIRLISPEGQVVDQIDYDPSNWGGNGVALERRSLNAPVSHKGNWGESVAILLGTPGLPNSVGPGNQAPEWVNHEVIDEITIKVRIEGQIDTGSITPNQFKINGGLTVIQINTDESFNILLTLDSEMISGEPYILSIEGIRDIFGNEMSTQQRSLIYYKVEQALPGDVVINEFMYNEPDDYSRYIELFNRSDKIIDLSGWRQANNTGTRRIISDETLLFHPNEYIVITPDDNLLFFFPELQILNAGSRLSALKNGGDSIIIENQDSVVIDSLSYTPEWGGAGVSIERKSVDVASYFRENWSESTASLLGTPGEPNTAVIDTDPPEIVQIQQFENHGFKIELSKRPEPASALNLNNYVIRPNVTISHVELSKEYLIIIVESGLVNNETYSISISGISDIFGNVMESTEIDQRYFKLSDVRTRDVVVNEILYRRKETGSPEFVELFNRTDKNFDLSGWNLSNSTESVALPDGLLLSALEYLVFTDSELLASKSENIIHLSGFRSLNNSGDIVMISDRDGIPIDSLQYLSSWQNNPPGVSLERRDPSALSIDPYNWMKSNAQSGSTPGEMNSRFEIDDRAPEIIFVNLFHPDSLEVIFNKFIDLYNSIEETDFSEINVNYSHFEEVETPAFSVNGERVPILWYNPKKGQRVVIGPGYSGQDDEMILTVDHIEDHNGNAAIELRKPIVRPLESGDLVFNEIMYQPISDNRDGMPDQSEYIEIFNRRSYPISLEGIFLHNEPDNSGNYTIISPVNSTHKWIPGHGFLLFYPETTISTFDESRVAVFFDISEVEDMIPIRMDRNSLSLPNTGRQIFLADSVGNTIDWVDYTPDWHNPNLIDIRGIALERINPYIDTNDPLNWSSSANIEGGTPGQQNSIYQTPEKMVDQRGVSLNPNPFSPDGSGFQDHLFINYKLDEPDYLIRIRIFDRYGRLVRNLVHGEPAGFDGSYIWDGRTDDGQTNRIGIYIILLEAYNSSTGRTLQFKETAVLARQF